MGPKARYIESSRLILIPATPALTEADMAGRSPMAQALDVAVPENWPPELYTQQALVHVQAQLQDRAEKGWSNWYLASKEEPVELIGVCGFKGRPDLSGSVEISYSILEQFRNRGMASEAVNRLVEWAFCHSKVMEVTAETFPHLLGSIRVLEKNGFRRAGEGSELGVVRYALSRTSLI